MATVYRRGTAGNPSPIPNTAPKPATALPTAPSLAQPRSQKGWRTGALLLFWFLLLILIATHFRPSGQPSTRDDQAQAADNPDQSASVNTDTTRGLSQNPRERALQLEYMGNAEATRIMSEQRHERIQSYIRRHEYEWTKPAMGGGF